MGEPNNGIVLYHYSFSPVARRVLWYLSLRGIDYAECVSAINQCIHLSSTEDLAETATGPSEAGFEQVEHPLQAYTSLRNWSRHLL